MAQTGKGVMSSLDQKVEAVLSGNRAALARAITLVESRRADHQQLAHELVQALLPHAGNSCRIGLTGVPGVGKSTTIEALGCTLIDAGHKVAVLAVDPSSSRSGGSILGDKTRMAELARRETAFVRPSPTGGTLGGVTARTREAIVLCEAAGHDVIIVETVGAGQSETAVARMTDIFVVLMLPGAGDQMQGIKKGVLELADMICINKADGPNAEGARAAATEYEAALSIITPAQASWRPPVLRISGLTNQGLDELWGQIERYRRIMTTSGDWEEKRRTQQAAWMRDLLEMRLLDRLRENAGIARLMPELEAQVCAGRLSPALAVERILKRFDRQTN
jgi:LAO/AO transport system kinase